MIHLFSCLLSLVALVIRLAFWSGAYEPDTTQFVSDPTANDSPVGVDWYFVGEQGKPAPVTLYT